MHLSELPPPETLVEGHDGMCWALMFHFACEHHDLKELANEQGFDLSMHFMEGNEDGLYERYNRDEGEHLGEIMSAWQPTKEGWLLAGKWDTDDGPVAVFIRRHEKAEVA